MRSLFLIVGLIIYTAMPAAEIDARQLVRQAMDHWRGVTSYSEMTMTIHRPDWERTMTISRSDVGGSATPLPPVSPTTLEGRS